MTRWFRPDRPIAEPQFGEEIMLIGPDGRPNNLVSKVRRVVSEDRDDDIWEVVDSFNHTRYVSPTVDGSWIEVELE